MHDDARKSFIPAVKSNIQNNVIDKVKAIHPERIYGIEQGDSYFLNFS
jgi:hypothetical protein